MHLIVCALLPLLAGPRPVGFSVLQLEDRSRQERPAAFRPMQLAVWYPAQDASAGTALTLADYVHLRASERGEPEADAARKKEEQELAGELKFYAGAELGPEAVQKLLATPARARLDAARAAGRFPVAVLVAQDAAIGAPLGELLASHGYLVVGFPAFGPAGDATPGVTTPLKVETRVRDLEFVAAWLAGAASADKGRVALLSFSTEAIPAFVYEMRGGAVRAQISLDGWDGLHRGALLGQKAPGWDLRRLRAPLLRLEGALPARELHDRALFEEAAYSSRARLELPSLRHFDFLPLAQLPGVLGDERRPAAERHATAVLDFLEAELRGDGAAALRLAALPLVRHAALEVPPAEAIVDQLLHAEDAGPALQALKRSAALGALAVLDRDEVNALGYQLAGARRLPQAVAVLALNAQLHPDWDNAWDSLAEVQALAGDKAAAIASYRKELAMDPRNQRVQGELAKLGVQAPAAAAGPKVEDEPLLFSTPGMDEVRVSRDLVYGRDGQTELRLDLYRPRAVAASSARVPVVLFILSVDAEQRHWRMYRDWARAAAASGLAAVLAQERPSDLDDPARVLDFLRDHGAEQGLDAARVAIWASSANGSVGARLAAQEQRRLRCAVFYYAVLDTAAVPAGLPMQIVRAGKDTPAVNQTLDGYAERLLERGAPVTVLSLPWARHGFDLVDDVPQTGQVVAGTLAFLRDCLAP